MGKSRREQIRPRTPTEAFASARRLYRNALERLHESPRDQHIYLDAKPVQEACALAYLAALKAVDGALMARGLDPDRLPESINAYEDALRRLIPRDGKLRHALVVAYQNLHLLGYYRGGVGRQMIQEGMEKARLLIATFAPDSS